MNRNRIKRAAAEAAGWICAPALWIVVAAMECGVLRPLAGAALGLGLELVGALALCKAGVVRLPETGEDLSTACGRSPSPFRGGKDGGRQGREADRW